MISLTGSIDLIYRSMVQIPQGSMTKSVVVAFSFRKKLQLSAPLPSLKKTAISYIFVEVLP